MNAEESTLSVTDEFDVFNWLKRYDLGLDNIDKQDMDSVLQFPLMWSLFESKTCNSDANIPKLEQLSKKLNSSGQLNNEVFAPHLIYFQQRYLDDGKTNNKFERLFRRNNKQGLVESVLMGEENKCDSVVFALLIIIYRFRNNFFHGEKPVSTLRDQTNNFTVANSLLAKVLELHKSDGKRGHI